MFFEGALISLSNGSRCFSKITFSVGTYFFLGVATEFFFALHPTIRIQQNATTLYELKVISKVELKNQSCYKNSFYNKIIFILKISVKLKKNKESLLL